MEKDQPPQSSQDARSDAELRKLNLEIEVLKGHNPWIETFVKLVPVVTTLVALLGLFFTVLQAINVQREERINKIQSQIRADKEQILDFITNDKISSVRVAFLIDDLDSLIKELSDDEGEANAITEHLMRVAWELPFDRRRDFDFDVSALKRWAHYRRFWQSYPDSHHMFLVKKYYPRLSLLHAQQAPCIEKADYEAGVFSYQNTGQPCPEALIDAFLDGFREHLTLIKETNEPELLRKELDEFRRLTNDSVLAGKFSAIYLPSK